MTLFGARLFKHITFFIGFLLAVFITYYGVPSTLELFGTSIKDDTLLYLSLSVGALTGVLLTGLYNASVFLCGAIGGAIVSQVLWILVVSNADVPDKSYIVGLQIGVLFLFALIGGCITFKFVEQVHFHITFRNRKDCGVDS